MHNPSSNPRRELPWDRDTFMTFVPKYNGGAVERFLPNTKLTRITRLFTRIQTRLNGLLGTPSAIDYTAILLF